MWPAGFLSDVTAAEWLKSHSASDPGCDSHLLASAGVKKLKKINAFVEDCMQYDTDTQGDTNNTLLLVMSFASKIPFCMNSSACITLNWHARTNQIY